MEEKLTACNKCANQIRVLGEQAFNRCAAHPKPYFDAQDGRWIIIDHLCCYDVNTDGHCHDYVEKIEIPELKKRWWQFWK